MIRKTVESNVVIFVVIFGVTIACETIVNLVAKNVSSHDEDFKSEKKESEQNLPTQNLENARKKMTTYIGLSIHIGQTWIQCLKRVSVSSIHTGQNRFITSIQKTTFTVLATGNVRQARTGMAFKLATNPP